MMVRDMQEFGNSIVEIVVGQTSEEASEMQQVRKAPVDAGQAVINLLRQDQMHQNGLVSANLNMVK